jgi:RNA ligase (TIGR02306 family)
MRKLATIRQIAEVAPIENADQIERVRIDGWWCVSKKNEFKAGDSCCYFEVDSLLPTVEPFLFLENKGRKKTILEGKEIEGYRLKTIKLRGSISQGLALPLSSFSGLPTTELGADVSEYLNVIKYEAPIPACLTGEVKGSFPGFIPKTDEERVQNLLDLLPLHKGHEFSMTEKVDGTSATYYKHQGEFGVCGRNWELRETEANLYWRMARLYKLEEKLPDGIAIQAEIIGEGVQANPLKIQGQQLRLFYVYSITSSEYFSTNEMMDWAQRLEIEHVPYLGTLTFEHTVEQLLEMANRNSSINKDRGAEGIVFRLNASGPKISFKSISNKYLLKNE